MLFQERGKPLVDPRQVAGGCRPLPAPLGLDRWTACRRLCRWLWLALQ